MVRMRGSHGRAALAAGAACVGLAACAAGGTDAPAGAGAQQGLFRAPAPMSGAVAPSPRSGWYVPARPPRYVKMGLAREHAPPRRGLAAWVARLFGGKAAEAQAPALIADTSGLPVPSVVTVENVRTGATARVRVEERAALGDHLISLSPATARGLGAQPGEPLLVRVRYAEPVLAYRDGTAALKLAPRGLRRGEAQLARAPGPEPARAAARAPEAAIVTASAAPVRAAPPPIPQATAPKPQPKPAPPVRLAAAAPAVQPARAAARKTPFRVQAGAFAKPKNAERAVAMLAPAGRAAVEPVRRGGTTLYRVYLSAPARPAAEALKARAAELGFKDAHIVG